MHKGHMLNIAKAALCSCQENEEAVIRADEALVRSS